MPVFTFLDSNVLLHYRRPVISPASRYSFALTYLARIILAAVWYPTPSS
jgi:hypothetical protein